VKVEKDSGPDKGGDFLSLGEKGGGGSKTGQFSSKLVETAKARICKILKGGGKGDNHLNPKGKQFGRRRGVRSKNQKQRVRNGGARIVDPGKNEPTGQIEKKKKLEKKEKGRTDLNFGEKSNGGGV